MRLIIDAVGNSAGGGLQVLKQLTCALLDAAPDSARVSVCLSSACALEALEPNVSSALELHRCELAQPLPGRAAWMLGGVNALIEQLKPSLVLSLNGMGLTRAPQAVLVQQPLLFDMRGLASMPWSFAARMAAIRAITAATCARAQLVIAQTPQVRDELLGAFALEPDKVEVFWPAINPSASADTGGADALRLLYIGHHAPYKNTSILLKVMRRLWLVAPEATLTLTGALPGLRHHDPRVIIHPHLEHHEVMALMRRSQFLLMPSLSETVGLPMLEAMSAGALIIAADRPYARAVCGDGATFVQADDISAWVEAICALRQSPARQLTQLKRAQARQLTLARKGPQALAQRLWGMVCQEPKPCT